MNFVAVEGSFPLDTALPLLKDDDELVVGELPAAFAHNDLRARGFLEVRRLVFKTHSQHVCFDEDDEVVGSPPPDHKSIDIAWAEWKPTSPGGKSFKETVDMIERSLSK